MLTSFFLLILKMFFFEKSKKMEADPIFKEMAKKCMRLLVSLNIFFIFSPVSGSMDAVKISSSGGEQLLKIIDTISMMSMQNGEEIVYHLCSLSHKRLLIEDQRNKISDFMAIVEPRINARDQKIKGTLMEKTIPNPYQNEHQAARYLYQLTAASLLTSLTEEEAGFKLPQDLKNVVNRLFPEIPQETPGYRIAWAEVIPGEEFELEATPFEYKKTGFRSFLLLYSNGFVSFYGGDFLGDRIDLEDEKKEKIQFDTFFNQK